jgi:NTF2 fold immunity protein
MSTNPAKIFCSCLTVILLMCVLGASKPKLPMQGVVPDEPTAVKVAEAILPPIFGAEEVAKWLPYHAQLDKNGVWTVYGTLPQGSRGGTPMLKIRKQDGQVLEVWHSL